MNKCLVLLIPLALALFLFVPSIPRAHAATGLVCMTTITATSCPASPPAFGPFTVGTKFRVGIFIQNSDAMAGWDIYVKSDPGVLTATGANLGPVIVTPTLTSICINGVATTGACTVNTANGNGVVEATTIESSGGNECAGLSPCSGMALFINYTVIASASSTPLSYPTAAGCSVSSVGSPPNVCVQVADNVGTTLPENIQGATVVQTASPDFTIAAVPNFLAVNSGSNTVSSIILTSVNHFNGTAVLRTTPQPTCPSCPKWNVNPPTILLPPIGSNSSRLTFYTNTTTQASTWNVTVTATLRNISHSVSVMFTVIPPSPTPNFIISTNSPSLTIPSGSTNSTRINLTSTNGFTGAVTLSLHVSPINPQTIVTLFPSTISLSAGGSGFSTLAFQSSQTGNYNVLVNATSGALSHALLITARVVDFSFNANPSSLTLQAGTSGFSFLSVGSVNGFSGTVSLSASVPSAVFGVSLNPTALLVSSGGVSTSTVTVIVPSSTQAGVYTIVLAGTSLTLLHNVVLTVTVVASHADFAISAFPTQQSFPAGSTVASTIILRSINGTSGTVTLTTSPPPLCASCPTWSIAPSSVTLFPGGNFSATLTFFTTTSTPANSYVVTVTGTFGILSRSVNVGFTVTTPPPPDFTITANPPSLIISAGATVTSQIQVSAVIFNSNSVFNVTLSARTQPMNGPTVTINPATVTVFGFNAYSILTIGSTPTTTVGNYTIIVTGMSNGHIHSITVSVQLLPPPTIKLIPTSGPVGTKVLVQGSNFPISQYGSTEILVTFDDQLVGFTFTSSAGFNFTFNVPQAQTGSHLVKASIPFFSNSALTVTAPFQVTPTPSAANFNVNVDVGTIYFPGDKATAFILVNQNGLPVSPADLQLTVQLIKPDGTTQTLTTTKITTGVYSAIITIPATSANPVGTYAIIAKAHSSSLGDSAALRSFEVKPSWLAQNGRTLTTGATLAVSLGAIGLAWKKGYFKKKDEQSLPF